MNILVFFTYDVNLKVWIESGLLSREIEIYRRLHQRGHNIGFVTYGDESEFQLASNIDFSVQIFPLYLTRKKKKNKFLNSLSTLLTVATLSKRKLRHFDVIKSNQLWGSWAALLCAALTRRPFILRSGYEYNKFAAKSRSIPFRVLAGAISFLLYHRADRLVFTTVEDALFVRDRFIIRDSKICIIPNLICTDKFSYRERNYHGDVIMVSRLEPQKDLFLAIDVIRDLGLSLTIVGKGSLRNEIIRRARDLKGFSLIDRVDNDDLPELLSQHKAYLSTSLYEGNPKSTLEAMAAQVVVIVRNSEGLSSIIHSGVNGYVFTSRHELKELLARIVKLESSDTRVTACAREFVKSTHGVDVILEKEEELYAKLVKH